MHCVFIFLFKKWLGPIGTFYASVFTLVLTLLFNLNELYLILSNGNYYYIDFGRWFFCLDLIDSHLVFCVDTLALVGSTLVLTLTIFALYFGTEYMYREAFINRLLYLLNMFATSVVCLFFSFDFFLVIFSWECIGLFSFLLVNFYSTRIYTVKAALKTFVFSRISDMFMFWSFLVSIVVFNTTDLSLLFLQIPFTVFYYIHVGQYSYHLLTVFSVTLVLSGGIKAAQFFSHVWLPDAMEAPTPASALIHSSTLVIAGVFLIMRFSVLFEFVLFTNHILMLWGSITLAFGSITAIFQQDIKKLVAYSTISQIGYLVCGCGFGCYEEVLLYLIIHAMNKAFLFVLVGYTVHFFNGNTDMRQMGNAYLYSFDLTIFLFGACFNLAGLPYSAGFVGKEFLLFQVLKEDILSLWTRGCWLVSFFFTPIYMFILIFVVFFGPKKGTLPVYTSITSLDNLYEIYFSSKMNLTRKFLLAFESNKQYDATYQQLTYVTSRTTTFILLFFWIFFFYSGESLLLILLNYNTLIDSIISSNFTSTKNHNIFSLNTISTLLELNVNCFIWFFTTLSVYYLSTVTNQSNVNYVSKSTLIDKLWLVSLITLFLTVLI